MAAAEPSLPRRKAMKKKDKKPGWGAIVGSVLAAAFGVQSSRNRERDFSQGSWLAYVLAGILFASVFVFGLLMLVKLVLRYTAV